MSDYREPFTTAEAGREAGLDAQYDNSSQDVRREQRLWGGRVPKSNKVTYYCGDCDTRNAGASMHKEGCRNTR